MFRLKLDAKILDWRSKRYANKMEKKNHVKVDDYYRFYDRDFIVDTLQFKDPVGSFKGHVDRITYYHGKTKEDGKVKKRPARDTYRNNKAYRKRKRPPYIENAYVRAVFCVWNSQKSTKEAEK